MRRKSSNNIFALAMIFISPTHLQPARHLHRGLNSQREKGYERELHVCILIRTGQSMEWFRREYLMFNHQFMQNNPCFLGFPAHPQQWL